MSNLTPEQFQAQLRERKLAQKARGEPKRFNAFEMRLNPIKDSIKEFADFCQETSPGQGVATLKYLKEFITSLEEKLITEHERKKNERAKQPAYEPPEE